MSKAEQICPRHTSPGGKKFAKRQARRARRRSEKKDLESAATKIRHLTQGWTD